MGNLDLKIVHSLEKCFLDDDIGNFKELTYISGLKNETLSFQLIYAYTATGEEPSLASLAVEGPFKDCITIHQVVSVPSFMPISTKDSDSDYLRTTPGLYPDLLLPLHYNNRIRMVPGSLLSIWVELQFPSNIKGGDYEFKFTVYDEKNNVMAEKGLVIGCIDALLPKQKYQRTEWFHTDCLAEYYQVPMFSEEHWEIIENYIKTAVEHEINVIMMPVFTPALDTYVGGERMTSQLVDIYVEDGKYSFYFEKMDRWISVCKACGVEYYEIPPLFTQWGAKNAPKFMATVNGEYKRIFGWETDAASPEYSEFLDCFLPALIARLKQHGIDQKSLFHISDEPDLNDIEHYKKASAIAKKHLKNYTVLDAVWSVELYEAGILSTPVVSIAEVDTFLNAGAKDFWIYICGGHTKEVSNRFLSMPSARTRILGIQMYKYDIRGFLHWGYNFYHNRYSYDAINPYTDTTGEYFAASGDMFLVYPGEDRHPRASIRLKVLRDSFQDVRALLLCEELYDREFVVNLLQENLDYELNFKQYPKTADYILNIREKVNEAIREAMIGGCQCIH